MYIINYIVVNLFQSKFEIKLLKMRKYNKFAESILK